MRGRRGGTGRGGGSRGTEQPKRRSASGRRTWKATGSSKPGARPADVALQRMGLPPVTAMRAPEMQLASSEASIT